MFKKYLVIFFMVLSLASCATTNPVPPAADITNYEQEIDEAPEGRDMTMQDVKNFGKSVAEFTFETIFSPAFWLGIAIGH